MIKITLVTLLLEVGIVIVFLFVVRSLIKGKINKPLDDSNTNINEEDFHNNLRKFVSNNTETIYSVLGKKNALNLLQKSIDNEGFCILTDRAAYFIGKVKQKKWIFSFKANIQHRIIASELKGVNVTDIWHLSMFIYASVLTFMEINLVRYWTQLNDISYSLKPRPPAILYLVIPIGQILGMVTPVLCLFCWLRALLHRTTNICMEFTSLKVVFPIYLLGKTEIKDFYKAVSKVQELNPLQQMATQSLNTVQSAVSQALNIIKQPNQPANVYGNKVNSLSELSKLYEQNMITQEEFEKLKQEIIDSQ